MPIKSYFLPLTLPEKAEEQFFSWCYWQFKYYNDFTTQAAPGVEGFYSEGGSLQTGKVALLGHPYAYFICGTPLR